MSGHGKNALIVICILALFGAACGPDQAPPEEAPPAPPTAENTAKLASADDTPDGLTPQAWQRIRDQIRQDAFPIEHFEDVPGRDGSVYVADNTPQKFRGVFDETRLVVEPADEPGWTFSMELASWGRTDQPVAAPVPTRRLSDGRLEYRRGDIVEWYLHDERGIEQGFDVLERPAGDGPLRIDLNMGGPLQPKPAGEDAVSLLSPTGEHVLRYGGLVVYDADGMEVDARFEVTDRQVGIVVDDREARYPLVVDPWIERKKLDS